jgi:cob(I)alamin adenosyltransferase
MSPFYTTKGDAGDTGILGPGRVSKSSIRIEAVGSVDEATAVIGLARSLAETEDTKRILLHVQKTLYLLMSEVSADPDVAKQFDQVNQEHLKWLENEIRQLEEKIDMPREFIIPGETPASSALSLARAVVRRSERRVIALFESGGIKKDILIAYLNRLSSLIFVLEIFEINFSGGSLRLAKEG